MDDACWVWLLPIFIRLGHEGQDLLSLCDGMHVYTDQTLAYTLIQKSFEGIKSEPKLTPKKKSPLLEAQRRTEPMILHHAVQRAQHAIDRAIPAPPPPPSQLIFMTWLWPIGRISTSEGGDQEIKVHISQPSCTSDKLVLQMATSPGALHQEVSDRLVGPGPF